MKQVNEQAVKLNEFGLVDTAYYIQKARDLRNQAIKEAATDLVEGTKALFNADAIVANTAKTA